MVVYRNPLKRGMKSMNEKIYLKELLCYKNASEDMKKHKLYCPQRYFNLSRLPNTGIALEMDGYIRERGMNLTPLSIRSELYPFHMLCDFLRGEYPNIQSFKSVEEDEMQRKAKIWMMKNGKSITQKRKRISSDKISVEKPALLRYIHRIYCYIEPEQTYYDYNSDRWYLAGAPMSIKTNPTKHVESISFKKISQLILRNEIKQVMYMHLSELALGTVCAEMTAINRFSAFLVERYPEIESINNVDREVLEEYLVYINTEAKGRKSYSKELHHLRSIFTTAGKILENKELEDMFYIDDIGKEPSKLYKVYSDTELKKLNAAIVEGDVQIARALMLHQLLGTRISETLSLKQNAVREKSNGITVICIQQIKTRNAYEKSINEDVKKLFEKACEYTCDRYGEREYVFVNDKRPDEPMQYARIQYQLMAMIRKNDLRDDSGKLFGVGTHIWRHCYGRRLTELHVDDVIIAKLLGHANTSSLKYYRKIGNQMLADETRAMRNMMDDMLNEIISEWN